MLKNEPAITAGTIVTLISALLAAGAAFGLNLTKEQVAAVIGVVAILGPILASLLTRGYVTPVAAPSVPGAVVVSSAPVSVVTLNDAAPATPALNSTP